VNNHMMAAVLYGKEHLQVEPVAVPTIASGDILVRVKVALTCGTDVKVFRRGYHARMIVPPAVFGHELAGDVVAIGEDVTNFAVGQRVVAANSAPCGECFFCKKGLENLCEDLLFNNGAYAQYIRIPARIVQRNTYLIPDEVGYQDAALVEPLACVVRGFEETAPSAGDTVAIVGLGPIGLMFTMLTARTGARVAATDTIDTRLELSARCGAEFSWDPRTVDVAAQAKALTEGRGADLVIVAASVPGIVNQAIACSRPGSRILLFAQTSASEKIEATGADICVGERTLFGCYSASIDLQKESARLVFGGEIPVEALISHRLPLVKIRSGFDLALHPGPKSLKIIVQPQRWS